MQLSSLIACVASCGGSQFRKPPRISAYLLVSPRVRPSTLFQPRSCALTATEATSDAEYFDRPSLDGSGGQGEGGTSATIRRRSTRRLGFMTRKTAVRPLESNMAWLMVSRRYLAGTVRPIPIPNAGRSPDPSTSSYSPPSDFGVLLHVQTDPTDPGRQASASVFSRASASCDSLSTRAGTTLNAAGKGFAHSGATAKKSVLDAGRKGAASACSTALHAGTGAMHAGAGAVAMGRQILHPGQLGLASLRRAPFGRSSTRHMVSEASPARVVVREQGSFRDVQALDRAIRNWADLLVQHDSGPHVPRIAARIPAFRGQMCRRSSGIDFAAEYAPDLLQNPIPTRIYPTTPGCYPPACIPGCPHVRQQT